MVSIAVSKVAGDGTEKDASTIAAEYEVLKKARVSTKMDEARAELILRVEDGQLSHMRSRDPLEIWQTLERVHRAAGFATSLALRRKFLTSKKSNDQSMQAWIGAIQGLAFRMEEAGIDVSDQDRILALTMGLPASYDAVIINFDSTPSELLTLNHVVARLLNEEVRQEATDPKSSKAPDELDEAMAAVGSGGGRRKKVSDTVDVTCYFCDQKGHYKSECPEKRTWENAKKKKSGSAAMAFESSDSEGDGVF